MNRTYLFISITSLALVVLLIIQVNWILNAARIKEELFNEKANMVLSRTAEALSSDTTTYNKLQIFAGKQEVRKIDSLFNRYMKVYNIHIDYYFEVKPAVLLPDGNNPYTSGFLRESKDAYTTCLEKKDRKEALELKLVFPEKEQFIRDEMGGPFITSVVLIIVVLVLSWRTILSLLKEKKIAEHITDFLNNMTHEFKTPLTNIALAGRMIQRDASKEENKNWHYSEIILEENEKLRLQVEQVLSMTALERGEVPVQLTSLDMHQLINDCLKRMSMQLENKHGKVTYQPQATQSHVYGDRMHLSNALCNLIDNAIKYSEEYPELLIQTKSSDTGFELVISDKGIGIEKQYQKKVFEKFFRVPTGDVHNVKGFGLGLAYIRKIIELHGGRIELKSEHGEGTTFIISLPNA